MSTEMKLPDELFIYRLFLQGAQIKLMTETRTIEEMWKRVKTETEIFGYEEHSGVFSRAVFRSSSVNGIDQPLGTDPLLPNRAEKRRDAVPPEPRMPSPGQIAKKR